MKATRERTSLSLGTKIVQLRKEKGMTQADFAVAFSEFCGMQKVFQPTTISSWEQNHRYPSMPTIVQLSLYFGCSLDYLFGISDYRNNTGGKEKQQSLQNLIKYSEIPILAEDMPKYDGRPVFVKFKTNEHLNQWGILNYNKQKIVCKEFVVSITVQVECYAYDVQTPIRSQITSYNQMLNTEFLWIEMITADAEIRGIFNGRYTHTPDKKCLVKMENSLPLSYNGLNVSYRAFKA